MDKYEMSSMRMSDGETKWLIRTKEGKHMCFCDDFYHAKDLLNHPDSIIRRARFEKIVFRSWIIMSVIVVSGLIIFALW